MRIDTTSALKLATFAGATAIAVTCRNLGLGEHGAGLAGAALTVGGVWAETMVGHLGTHLALSLLEKVPKHPDGSEAKRAGQNRDVHRLIGKAIARVLEREAKRQPGSKFGSEYLIAAAKSFRREWMAVELTGAPVAPISETNATKYLTGDAPVLDPKAWFALVEEVAKKGSDFRFSAKNIEECGQALKRAAARLREEFATEFRTVAKEAWETRDPAWSELIFRLLALISEDTRAAVIHDRGNAKQLSDIEGEIKALRAAIIRSAVLAEFGTSQSDGAQPDEGGFAVSITRQMGRQDRRFKKLTLQQLHAMDMLKDNHRLRISGIAGSGKTVVAAEWAIRLAGPQTLFLCHNPRLADYVIGLTKGHNVEVAYFTQWVDKLAGTSSIANVQWSKYEEPTDDTLRLASDHLANWRPKDRYAAIIVDEGQDFREEWWKLVEAAMKPQEGRLYIFHDDKQALLPYRAQYPFDEPICDLSRNCRNASQIYELMRCLHPAAPPSDRELLRLGGVCVETFEPDNAREAIERAIRWCPQAELERLKVLFTGNTDFKGSIFDGLSLPIEQEMGWQDEVRRMFALAAQGRHTLKPPPGGISALLKDLTHEYHPSAADVDLVRATARCFEVRPDVRREILSSGVRRDRYTWQIVDGRARLRRSKKGPKPFASEIIIHFEKETWDAGLRQFATLRFGRENLGAGRVVPVYHVSEFKGLESSSVLLYIHDLGATPAEELLVGISRAQLLLAVVVESAAGNRIPPPLKRALRNFERNRFLAYSR